MSIIIGTIIYAIFTPLVLRVFFTELKKSKMAANKTMSDDEITVHSFFSQSYTFTFGEIVSVLRQVKRNQLRSERMVIKTATAKKLIVESSEISYERFLQRIRAEVKRELLVGFEGIVNPAIKSIGSHRYVRGR